MKRKLIYLYISIVVIVLFFVIGLSTTKMIFVNHHDISSDTNLTIAQFSDTHFKDDFKARTYQKVITSINRETPDVVLFTGDLFLVSSISSTLKEDVISFLSQIECERKYAVLGNHDHYNDQSLTDTVIEILETSGFQVLLNESEIVMINDQEVQFIGLDDLMKGDTSYQVVLDEIRSDLPTFVLSHEPDTFQLVKDKDIQTMFSGHSHGGQIRFPFIGEVYNVPGAKQYNKHHHQENGIDLYISFGLGESVVGFRFYNPRRIEIYKYS